MAHRIGGWRAAQDAPLFAPAVHINHTAPRPSLLHLLCLQWAAVSICTVLFLVVAIGSYATFGPGVPADVLENFSHGWVWQGWEGQGGCLGEGAKERCMCARLAADMRAFGSHCQLWGIGGACVLIYAHAARSTACVRPAAGRWRRLWVILFLGSSTPWSAWASSFLS